MAGEDLCEVIPTPFLPAPLPTDLKAPLPVYTSEPGLPEEEEDQAQMCTYAMSTEIKKSFKPIIFPVSNTEECKQCL